MSIILARSAGWSDKIVLGGIVLLFGGVGALMVLGGAFSLLKRIAMLFRGRRTTGTIIGYRSEDEEFPGFHTPRETITGSFQIPCYRFTDEAGQIHEAEIIGTKGRRYAVGQTVPVVYLKNAPKTCMVNHPLDTWGGPLMMLTFGSVLLALCGWVVIVIW